MTTTPYKFRHLWGVQEGDSPFDAELDSTHEAFIFESIHLPGRMTENSTYTTLREALRHLSELRGVYLKGYRQAKAEDAPLLEALRQAVAPSEHFEAWQAVTTVRNLLQSQAEGRTP